MTELILIRHGQTSANKSGKFHGRTDIGLSDEGFRQVKKLAEWFPAVKIAALYTSDLRRAYETAVPIGKKFHCGIMVDKNLREMNFGAWEGLTYEEIACHWPAEAKTYLEYPDKLRIPEGETFEALQQRAVRAITRIVRENKNKTVAVVTHGAFVVVFLAAVLQIPLHCIWSLRQDNAAVNILFYEKFRWKVELVNGGSTSPQK